MWKVTLIKLAIWVLEAITLGIPKVVDKLKNKLYFIERDEAINKMVDKKEKK